MRMTRSNMLEVLQKPYVRTARLKGLPERSVVLRHALKNAMMPTVTLLSINVGWLVGGLVITEQVFAYPGLGDLVVDAIQKRDVPLIQGAALIISLVYIVANFAADLVYMWLNPKVRTG
jgi:peptide/nickel transport system permease protein